MAVATLAAQESRDACVKNKKHASLWKAVWRKPCNRAMILAHLVSGNGKVKEVMHGVRQGDALSAVSFSAGPLRRWLQVRGPFV